MKLYLIPTPLAPETPHWVAPIVREILPQCKYFLVEEVRTARRFISSLKLGLVIEELQFWVVDKSTKTAEIAQIFAQIPKGENVGLMSEAGYPCVADSGRWAVEYAHEKGFEIIPLVGASSIIMALAASGLQGQNFTFHGYVPIDKALKIKHIRQMEKDSAARNQAQIFMDTPFRNNALLADLLANLDGETSLCIAAELTSPDQWVKTLRIKDWKKQIPELHKKNCMMVLQKI